MREPAFDANGVGCDPARLTEESTLAPEPGAAPPEIVVVAAEDDPEGISSA